jgi:hypothetical protein
MESLGNSLVLVGIIAGWFVLNRYVLPRAGIPT